MKKNRGSVVVEMTLLMPVFLGCVYMYIMIFISLIHAQQNMRQAADILYAAQAGEYLADGSGGIDGSDVPGASGYRGKGSLTYSAEGDKIKVSFQGDDWLELRFQMTAGQKNPAKKLRKWQLIADML